MRAPSKWVQILTVVVRIRTLNPYSSRDIAYDYLRVSLWSLNMLQNEREIENEAWLGSIS